jgi:hypothetical protein
VVQGKRREKNRNFFLPQRQETEKTCDHVIHTLALHPTLFVPRLTSMRKHASLRTVSTIDDRTAAWKEGEFYTTTE